MNLDIIAYETFFMEGIRRCATDPDIAALRADLGQD